MAESEESAAEVGEGYSFELVISHSVAKEVIEAVSDDVRLQKEGQYDATEDE